MSKVIRYFSALDDLLRTTTPYASVSEANMGVDLALYAATGGFLRTQESEQMAQLRKNAGHARTGNSQNAAVRRAELSARTAFINSVLLRTSSRRLQLAFSQGFGPHEAWAEEAFPFSTTNDSLDRSQDPESFPTELEPAIQARLLEGIDSFYRNTIAQYIGLERFTKARTAARHMLGLSESQHFPSKLYTMTV